MRREALDDKAPTKHRMGRRMHGWDYCGRGIYMVTITVEGRRPLLGQLAQQDGTWVVVPSATGRIVEQCLQELPAQWPGTSLLCTQLMPDHLHFILFVETPQPKPLGAIVGSLKAKSTSRYLASNLAASNLAASNLAASGEAQNREAQNREEVLRFAGGEEVLRRGARATERRPLWAAGYVDLVLLRRGQLRQMIAYLRDNPRRLAVKRAHPDLFKVVRDLEIALRPGEERGHFMAIGNHFLLDCPDIRQVQCSRSLFAYARERLPGGGWRILRDSAGHPIVEMTTPEFTAKADELLEAAKHGAVLVSPCISHGEREIARRAFEAGYRLIALRNKGFPPIYKPGGLLFDRCAEGKLLLLAPAAWPYTPGDKPPTRETSLVLNRLAQGIAGEGAAKIDYRGVVPQDIEAAVAAACAASPQ